MTQAGAESGNIFIEEMGFELRSGEPAGHWEENTRGGNRRSSLLGDCSGLSQ